MPLVHPLYHLPVRLPLIREICPEDLCFVSVYDPVLAAVVYNDFHLLSAAFADPGQGKQNSAGPSSGVCICAGPPDRKGGLHRIPFVPVTNVRVSSLVRIGLLLQKE